MSKRREAKMKATIFYLFREQGWDYSIEDVEKEFSKETDLRVAINEISFERIEIEDYDETWKNDGYVWFSLEGTIGTWVLEDNRRIIYNGLTE